MRYRNIIISVMFFLILSSISFAYELQPSVKFYISDYYTYKNTNINIPIKMNITNQNGLGSLQLSLFFDSNIMQVNSVTKLDNSFNSLVSNIDNENGTINIACFQTGVNGVGPGNITLAILNVTVVGNYSETTCLNISIETITDNDGIPTGYQTINGSLTIKIPQYTLTISVIPSESGYVTLTPSGGIYNAGKVITVDAHANSGYKFDHWSGDASGTDQTTQITMNSNKTIFAHFISTSPPLTNHPPIATITTLEDGTILNGTVVIEGIASDEDGNETIQKVEAKIDNGSWNIATGTTSWSYEWNTTQIENGQHTIYARAYDGELYSDIVSISVNVFNNHQPFIEITEPENGSVVKGSIVIKGKAWDIDGNETLQRVEIKIDDGEWKNATGILNWAYTLDTKKLDNGDHTIKARAYDGHNYSNIVSIQIEVKNKKGIPGFELIALLAAAVAVALMRKKK